MSTIQLSSDTLAGTAASGQIEYNGQYYVTDSNASRGQIERLVQGTLQNSTSGTSIDFTGIPSWAKRITIMFNGVSTSATSPVIIQIGTSGGIQTTTYNSYGTQIAAATAGGAAFTAGFGIGVSTVAGTSLFGTVTLSLLETSAGLWTASGVVTDVGGTLSKQCSGSKTLSGVLDRVRITTVNGTDTFDAGNINIMYEG